MSRRSIAVVCGFLLLAATAAAETTRTMRGELTDVAEPFAVKNLAGVMRVVPGDGDTVIAVATVHAGDDALAGSVRFDRKRDKDGVLTLVLHYPVNRHRRFRYPGGGRSQVRYEGRRVKVSRTGGVLLWAEVEVQVPRRRLEATFRNVVGRLEAEGIEGRLRLDTSSGDIVARALAGEVTLDTGSGDVRAEAVRGELTCDTGSGDCIVIAFAGDRLSCDTGSGDVSVAGVTAGKVLADTGSGSVRVTGADIEEFNGDTGSGSIRLEVVGDRLVRARADTGSGDVTVRLPADASFVLHADQGSGDLINRFRDAHAIVKGRTVVGYERGDGRIKILADTGSGDVTIAPLH